MSMVWHDESGTVHKADLWGEYSADAGSERECMHTWRPEERLEVFRLQLRLARGYCKVKRSPCQESAMP